MKRVLVITYHFPPEGGPAVQRVTKFVKYFPHFNYMPIVLTSKTKIKVKDHSLLKDIPSSVEIQRSQDIGQFIPGDIRKKLFGNIFLPDKFALWKHTAIKKGVQLVNEKDIDIIFSTSPPHSVHLVANEISKTTGKPWIADFRDEWTDYPLFNKKNHHQIHYNLEASVLHNCSHLTTVMHNIKDNFSRKINSNKISIIPNGFDPDDFDHISMIQPIENNKLIITYCGRLNQLHSPIDLFMALSHLLKIGSIKQDQFIFNFVGNIENKKYFKNFPELTEMIKFHPYQPHLKCIELMAKSHALLLLATNMGDTQFFTSKVFEYFYLKKPILAIITRKGELSSLLDEYNNSYIAYEGNPEMIHHIIIKLYNDWFEKKLDKYINDVFLTQFNRKKQTEKLTQLFEKIMKSK